MTFIKPIESQRSGKPRGFTLIELMVGMTLGVIVLFALVTLFVNNSRMRRETDQASQQIENGRYALDLLRDDLHLSGYYGDSVPQTGYTVATATIPNVCATTVAGLQFVAPPAALQWPVPMFGISGGDTVPTCVSSATGGQKAGTDILVVRRTSTLPMAGGLTAGKVYVQATGCKTDLDQHKDFVLDTGANAASFTRTKKDCATAADIYEFQTRIYYVSNETIPTLRVLTLSGTSSTNEPLVQGIEDMRVQFGRDDVGNDGTPDAFRQCLSTVDPCVATDWANMMAVRVNLLARNLATGVGYTDSKTYSLGAGIVVGPFDDHYKRHAYTAIVRLMNPAGRRERCSLQRLGD
jgi:type IV pilus assembly protein PilW